MHRHTLRIALAALVAVTLLGGVALVSADDGNGDGIDWTDAHDWMADHVVDHADHHAGDHGEHHDAHHDAHHAGDRGEHHDAHHDGEHAHEACH
ncbi:hypothetical protein [Natronobacterium texcoconense]|uniref:Cd2+/Zn2+-exporting ATPase n=1 Tax=Natronobacterium texcoconense TaxID=1095778 RepID=A0A1H1I2C1_NATTX|nr:hypothetical protein [Natronobacterium texcoconense]SDR31739.1 Cd2+/Zn2+-exporting ATPase [Natronobacterium texcoconense]